MSARQTHRAPRSRLTIRSAGTFSSRCSSTVAITSSTRMRAMSLSQKAVDLEHACWHGELDVGLRDVESDRLALLNDLLWSEDREGVPGWRCCSSHPWGCRSSHRWCSSADEAQAKHGEAQVSAITYNQILPSSQHSRGVGDSRSPRLDRVQGLTHSAKDGRSAWRTGELRSTLCAALDEREAK